MNNLLFKKLTCFLLVRYIYDFLCGCDFVYCVRFNRFMSVNYVLSVCVCKQ